MNCNVGELTEALKRSVRKTVSGKDVAVAFSGGLDCGIVAAMAKETAASVTLYVVGTEDSYDVREAKEVSKMLGLELVHISINADDLTECIRDMIRIAGTTDVVTLSFEVPLYYVCRYCKEKLIIGGQGADEIFAGYSKYVNLAEDEFLELRNNDIEKLTNVTLKHEKTVSEHFGKTVGYPYLDRDVCGFANDMEIKDLMPCGDRKTVLRKVAESIGQPEISVKKKKAAQYGSGAMDMLRKIAKNNGRTVNEMIAEWRE